MESNKALFWIGAILFALAIFLLLFDKLGPVTFTFFCGLVFMLYLALLGFPRLKELDLKNLRMLLAETKEVKKEIFLKKEDLKKHTLAFTKLVAFTGGMMTRAGDKAALDRRTKFIQKNCEKLLESLNASEEEKREAFKIINLLADYDQAVEKNDPQEKERISRLIQTTIEAEIN